ncbi:MULTISPECIES: PASTA domain-containing protein [Paenibacillus]|uniref:PASTA domain-containing protein n=1 Tax=Paenibacillus validus TaxID=44253 RepID=A0A7X2Z7F3_9BACL|nr:MULTISPECIES: PASTA domain-containing protein [Paenibacillus]MUG69735.1 PASTA domain-containing protein [Paenibacillus validus]
MEKTLRARYVLKKPVIPAKNGILFEGTDLSLRRDIVIFVSEQPNRDEQQAYMRLIQEVAHLNDTRFLHVLDVGFEDLSIYAVLKSFDGEPLLARLQRRGFTLADVVAMSFELSKGMLDALEKGIAGFSVMADNVWIGNDGHLKIINCWEKVKSDEQGARGLASLIYQLFMGTESIPSSLEQREQRLRTALVATTDERKDALLVLLGRAWRGQHTLSSFIMQLGQLSGQAAPDGAAGMPDKEEEVRFAIKREHAAVPAKDELVRSTVKDEIVEEEEEVEEVEEAKSGGFWKKSLIGMALFTVAAVTAVGVFLLFMELGIGRKSPDSQQTAAKSGQSSALPETPSAANPVPATPAEPQSSSEAQPGEGQAVTAPQLVGLSKEEAEKQALAAGLRYQFYLEKNPHSANTVFRQSPAPGTPLQKGDNVSFWVSKGP